MAQMVQCMVRSGPNFIPSVRSGPFGPVRKIYPTTVNIIDRSDMNIKTYSSVSDYKPRHTASLSFVESTRWTCETNISFLSS